MVTLVRRFLVVAALMFWSGGFVFYASVVVPIGTKVLGGATEQGFITRHVAKRINWAGSVALVPIAWDACTRDPARWRRSLRLVMVAGMLICLAMLFWLHPRMDVMLSEVATAKVIADFHAFDTMHRIYLWTNTVQFACSVIYAILSIAAWRAADRLV